MMGLGGSGGAIALDPISPATFPSGTFFVFGGQTVNATALANQAMYLYPFYVNVPFSFSKLGCRVTVAGDAGCTLSPAIYSSQGNLPKNLLYGGATVPGDVVATSMTSIAGTLTPGWYWGTVLPLGAPTTAPTTSSVVPTATGIWITGEIVKIALSGAPSSVCYSVSGQLSLPSVVNQPNPGVGAAPILIGQV